MGGLLGDRPAVLCRQQTPHLLQLNHFPLNVKSRLIAQRVAGSHFTALNQGHLEVSDAGQFLAVRRPMDLVRPAIYDVATLLDHCRLHSARWTPHERLPLGR